MTLVETTEPASGPDVPPYPPRQGAIDVHHHVVPDFYRQALADAGVTSPVAGVDDFPDWDVDASLAMMDRQGVATAMLSLSVPGVGLPDPTAARRLARRTNEFLAEVVAAHPGRFGAFAAIPLPDVDAGLAEARHALDGLGLDGVGLFTHYGRTYLGDPAFDPLLGELARRGTVGFVHPAGPHPGSAPDMDLPASVCEFPFATTRMATQMLYNGTFERHPDLRLILPHAGGTIPYLAERLTFAPVIRPTEHRPPDPWATLRSFYYDTAMAGNPITVGALRAFVPTEHIVTGTDFPFMPAWSSTRNGHQLVESGGFSADERHAVIRGNAERLFPHLHRAGT